MNTLGQPEAEIMIQLVEKEKRALKSIKPCDMFSKHIGKYSDLTPGLLTPHLWMFHMTGQNR